MTDDEIRMRAHEIAGDSIEEAQIIDLVQLALRRELLTLGTTCTHPIASVVEHRRDYLEGSVETSSFVYECTRCGTLLDGFNRPLENQSLLCGGQLTRVRP